MCGGIIHIRARIFIPPTTREQPDHTDLVRTIVHNATAAMRGARRAAARKRIYCTCELFNGRPPPTVIISARIARHVNWHAGEVTLLGKLLFAGIQICITTPRAHDADASRIYRVSRTNEHREIRRGMSLAMRRHARPLRYVTARSTRVCMYASRPILAHLL
jgi:hypothetical protein